MRILCIFSTALAAVSLLLVPPAHAGTVLNTAYAVSDVALYSEKWVAFVVPEAGQGVDLNNDGDTSDAVLQVRDLKKGTVANSGRDAGGGPLYVDSAVVAYACREANQGQDLNNDGDMADSIAQLYIIRTKDTVNLGIAVENYSMEGLILAMEVPEAQQNRDYNGDNDKNDRVLLLYVVRRSQLLNPKETVLSHRIGGAFIAFTSAEALEDKDLNNDNDKLDTVVRVFDIPFRQTLNPKRACSGEYEFAGTDLALLCPEAQQGNADLNGDGDTDDDVLLTYNVNSELVTRSNSAGSTLALDGKQAIITTAESDQGTDLNGDGDQADTVVRAWDVKQRGFVGTPLAVEGRPVVDDNYAAFRVSEAGQGNVDLNGDGDTLDAVLHVLDTKKRTVTNLQLAADELFLYREILLFQVSEASQGNLDRNGDADKLDNTFAAYNLKKKTLSTGPAVDGIYDTNGKDIVVAVSEAGEGNVSRNGDGDTADQVLGIFTF